MNKTISKKIFFIGLFAALLLTSSAFSVQAAGYIAQDSTPDKSDSTPDKPDSNPSPPGSCANFDKPTDTLCNPLPDKNVQGLVIRLLKWLMTVIAMVAVVAVVISGFRMVVSGGGEQEIKGAKRMLTWSIIGLVVASLAYSIIALTQNILTGR